MSDDLYSNTAARLDTIIGDAGAAWVRVSMAKTEYDTVATPKESFYVWLQQTYGLKLSFTPDGELELSNQIVDPQKYTVFLLKFGPCS